MIKYNLSFYLNKDKSKKSNNYVIYLYVRGGGKTLCINTKKKIEEQYWDIAKQKPKRHYKFELELNNYLQKFKDEVERVILVLSADNLKLSYDGLKGEIMKVLEETPKIDFFKTFDDYIHHKETTQTRGTTKVYRTCYNHLKKFESNENFRITFENINQIFYDKLQGYFIKLGNSNNYAKKMMVTLNTFLGYCLQREITSNNKFQTVKKVKSSDTSHIALTFEELKRLEIVELPLHLDMARDLFLFCTYTGQRYSDMAKFDVMDVKDDFWIIRQQKTKTVVRVPLHQKAIQLLSKYDYKLPKLANQKMNEYLKSIGELAKINEITKTIKTVGNQEIENVVPKYELLTTHTARRTFVTLAKYQGIDNDVVKSVTGHSSQKMLSKYFVKDTEDGGKIMFQIFDKGE